MYLTQYELLQYIRHSCIEGDWLTSLGFMGVVHIIHRFIQLTRSLGFIGGYRFYQFTALPFSIATVFSRVHQGSKRVEVDGSRRRHQYSPVYRLLANDNKFKTAMPGIHPLGGASCREPGLDHKFLKLDLFPTPLIEVMVTIRPQGRSSLPNSKEIYCLLGKTVTML